MVLSSASISRLQTEAVPISSAGSAGRHASDNRLSPTAVTPTNLSVLPARLFKTMVRPRRVAASLREPNAIRSTSLPQICVLFSPAVLSRADCMSVGIRAAISAMKLRAYVETTIPSYLTAWPRRDLIRAAEQKQTALWRARRAEYELVGSELLLEECGAGDAEAAAAQLAAVSELPLLEQGSDVASLAETLVRDVPLPPNAVADATHIALAAVHGIELLVTWNCRHIANPVLRPRVDAICRAAGYEPPSICTPAELLGGDDDART